MGRYYHSLSVDATIMVSKNCPIIGEQVIIIFVTPWQHYDLLKTPLISALSAYKSKTAR